MKNLKDLQNLDLDKLAVAHPQRTPREIRRCRHAPCEDSIIHSSTHKVANGCSAILC